MKYRHGLAFPDADQYLYDRLPENGVWQDDALQAGLKVCKNFRIAIDGGAHIGTWSLALAEKFEKVFAFEPMADTYEALEQNIKNHNEKANIEKMYFALGAETTQGKLAWREKDVKRKHTGARYIQECEGREADFLISTIDMLYLDDVDFIKLDLEGGETDALKGATETLKRCKPVIVFEDKGFNKRFGYPEDSARKLLSELGAHEIEKCGINRVWGWD